MTSDFKEYALQVLRKNNITPDHLIPVICLTRHNVRSIDNYVEYNDVQYTVKGHVMLHLMAKTAEMHDYISIYQISDH